MKGKIFTLLFIGVLLLGCTQNTITKVLVVKEIAYEGSADIERVSQILEQQTELNQINTLNWEAFPYQPKVSFRIGHRNNEIWIKYYIEEDHVLAKRTSTNSATHKDSCLEFFIDPQADGNYYNFEVNAIGTVHLAYGPGRGKRSFIDPDLIREKIKVQSSMGTKAFEELEGPQKWEMTLIIPSEIMIHDPGIQFSGLQANANFFKCGDESSKPHFLSWNPIGTERPDFHNPEYFGSILFE